MTAHQHSREAVASVPAGPTWSAPRAVSTDASRLPFPRGVVDRPAGTDLTLVPATSGQAARIPGIKRTTGITRQPAFGDEASRAISAAGAGTVATTYTPEAADKSTKIVFIQVMRELLDGVTRRPGQIDPSFAYQDKDTTSSFYHVDYIAGEKDPYYNGDDASDIGVQGNAQANPKVPASTSDTPNFNDGSFPGVSTVLDYQFRTAAFSAAGADAGTYYGYVDWTYHKEKGKTAATSVVKTASDKPGSKFTQAVSLFNSNHGFSMPGTGGLGVLLGAGIGALVGAGIGFLVGGPVGALVGGLGGLALGAGVGGFLS